MILAEEISIREFQDHLRRQGSAVSLDLATMPKPTEQYRAFRATLEAVDVDRIFLWFEFRKHSNNGTAKLTDVRRESASEKRIKCFIEGDAAKGRDPIDLRTARDKEPSLLTNDAIHGPLNGLDGNHRLVAFCLLSRIRG